MWDKWRMLVLICVLRWGPSFINGATDPQDGFIRNADNDFRGGCDLGSGRG
ncbi:hypothetical protein CK203_095072 [Vitis vinifera]|uniref:Uncharacterized protein n=1 Tax=Vitis vinifera TaxID=29760 RepID=A0A438EWP2_VITVI|nr:hypothetical protein CK203_095072 [Vitis vinifera]